MVCTSPPLEAPVALYKLAMFPVLGGKQSPDIKPEVKAGEEAQAVQICNLMLRAPQQLLSIFLPWHSCADGSRG